ncbi:MAG: hypothetical protein M3024_11660 [Candidatus Dormibacteraeota bacterium]|nr:hypothetical protein [Candidatus Dormibacteraeota bacterium]
MTWDPNDGGALNNPCLIRAGRIPPVPMAACGRVAGAPGCPPLNLVQAALAPTPGRIGFSPINPEMHLVNLKSCFWIDGAGVAEREVGIVDPRDQSIYYFYVRLGLVGVDWNFGDGSFPVQLQGQDGLGTPAPAADCMYSHNGSDHTYNTISQGTVPGDHYVVTASERYGMTAQGQRCDRTNGGGMRCSPGTQIDITNVCPAGYQANQQSGGCDRTFLLSQPIFVGQVEGIPVSGPGTGG